MIDNVAIRNNLVGGHRKSVKCETRCAPVSRLAQNCSKQPETTSISTCCPHCTEVFDHDLDMLDHFLRTHVIEERMNWQKDQGTGGGNGKGNE